jgi:hypothetical protein
VGCWQCAAEDRSTASGLCFVCGGQYYGEIVRTLGALHLGENFVAIGGQHEKQAVQRGIWVLMERLLLNR